MTSRDDPSCPAGKVWISTEPPVSSRTCLATFSIILTDGWLVGSTVAQRSVVAARARTGKAPIATLASPAPIHSRRVQRIGLLIASSFVFYKVESVAAYQHACVGREIFLSARTRARRCARLRPSPPSSPTRRRDR